MSSLSQVIESAKAKNATGLLIHPGVSPKIRMGHEWQNTDLAPISASQAQQLFTSWLSIEEKNRMETEKMIEGVKILGQLQFQFSFFQDFDGIKGSLFWKNLKAINNEWWGFSELTVDVLNRPQGLVFITGLRRSGKTSAIQSLLSAWSKKEKKSIFIVTDMDEWSVAKMPLASRVETSFMRDKSFPPSESDVIIIDSREASLCEKALRWAEDGRLVLFTMTAASLRSGLERFVFQLPGSVETNWIRLAHQFRMGMGLRLVPGTDLPQVGAYELALGSPQIIDSLKKQSIEQFENEMRSSEDRTLMRSMNQSLFQMVVKRQIEFRMAFENSSDPQELDELFRKVGI